MFVTRAIRCEAAGSQGIPYRNTRCEIPDFSRTVVICHIGLSLNVVVVVVVLSCPLSVCTPVLACQPASVPSAPTWLIGVT